MYVIFKSHCQPCGDMSQFCLDVNVVILFALLGTALAFRTQSEDEANSLGSAETEGDEFELALQQDKAEMMLTYAKLAEGHNDVHQLHVSCFTT